MKKVIFGLTGAAFLLIGLMMIAQTASAQANANDKGEKMNKKVLVAYYSWSGNTKELAKMIQKAAGGDLFEIETSVPYPKEYNVTVEQAKKEINEGTRRAIKGKVNNIDEYDIIFIGSPNWWGTIAPAVSTFLSEHDLSGKTVAPFFTHGGGGMQRCASDTAKLLADSNIADAVTFSGSRVKNVQADVEKWVNEVLK